MIIKKNDPSRVQYWKEMPRPIHKSQGMKLYCTIFCRHREMYLHAGIKRAGKEPVNIEVEGAKMRIFTLKLTETYYKKVLCEQEILVGTTYAKALQAWGLIRQYKTLPFKDIEPVLEENGFPSPEDFDKDLKDEIIIRARSREVVKGRILRDDVELLTTRIIKPAKPVLPDYVVGVTEVADVTEEGTKEE